MTSAAELSITLLKNAQIPLGLGLTEAELSGFEADFGFLFDADHRALLSMATPSGDSWFDWRRSSRAEIEARFAWPIEGALWDVHNNGFWPKSWGRRPLRETARDRIAREELSHVPRLVPIFSHRFMAAGPSQGGAPVFSVYQTDVVFYGDNLPDYVAQELKLGARYRSSAGRRRIPFWSALAEGDANYAVRPSAGGRAFWNRAIEGGTLLPETTTGEDGSSQRIDYTSRELEGPLGNDDRS